MSSEKDLSSKMPDKDTLRAYTLKLLEKANRHPELTPKILREKIEQKLKLVPSTLKPKRGYIKKTAIDWWIQVEGSNKTQESEKERLVKKGKVTTISGTTSNAPSVALQSLSRLAVVVGKGPHIFKSIANLTEGDKINYLRQKLRDDGLVFSDVPTTAEIENIRREKDLERELAGMDSSHIIEGNRKRSSGQIEEENNQVSPKSIPKKSNSLIVKNDDEEAEF